MASKLGKDYLERAASGQDLVKRVKEKKANRLEHGKKVILWKFIRKVFPQYKFYKFHAAVIELQQSSEKRALIIASPRTDQQQALAAGTWSCPRTTAF